MDKKQRGAAIVEFALILPLLLILTFITVEFGRALYEYNIIAKSVRDAVRYLSMQDPTIATTDPGKVAIAKRLVVFGNPDPAFTGPALARGLELSQVPDPIWDVGVGSNPSINTVTIRVTGYRFQLMAPVVFGLQFGDANGEISFGDISATMRAQS
jgi:Flp pilus assembly protein TadG